MPVRPEALLAAECWRPLLRVANPADRLGRLQRGIARSRLRDPEGALEEFREAARRGLTSPGFHAEWIVASLASGRPIEIREIHRGAAAILLTPGWLTPEGRELLRKAVTGGSPAELILSGRPEEALQALSGADPYDADALALRSLAWREKGDLEKARQEMDRAVRLNPWSAEFRRQRDVLERMAR
jgi:tetratricopeptide (TPR) repeat protein